jgi:8-oxo-dGTP pyrophosphatase MutT (NUDIX family)
MDILDKRHNVLAKLERYNTTDTVEKQMLDETISFIKENEDCFERSLLFGHLTGSSWIVNREMSHTLLIHHFKLDRWFQPGGHCDGDCDVLNVAVKEAIEETGLKVIPLRDDIFDIDIHKIPVRGNIPEHLHYDIRFLFEANMTKEDLQINRETKAIKWVEIKDVERYNDSPSIIRMAKKIFSL